MKQIVLFFILIPCLSFGQSITWDNPIEVNSNNSLGNTRPKIGITDAGNPVVM